MVLWDGSRWVRETPPLARSLGPPRRTRDWLATIVVMIGAIGLLLPLADLRAATPTLELQPPTVAAGGVVEAHGSGFTRNSQVQISIAGRPNPIITTKVNGNGSFRARFATSGIAPGLYTIVATEAPLTTGRPTVAVAHVARADLTVASSAEVDGLLARTRPSMMDAPESSPPGSTGPASPVRDAAAPSIPQSTPLDTAPTTATLQAPGSSAPPAAVAPVPASPVTAPPPPPPAPPAAPPPIAANPPVNGFVGRNGTDLVLNGAPYRFTGFNIYNANSRWNCWYQMADGRFGGALSGIGGGQEAVRVWFFQRLATSNGVRDWAAFDATLAAARTAGVRVIATLADHWGACENSGTKTEAWYTTGYSSTVFAGDIATYREFVREVVTRYGNDPTVLMWQLVNEAETPRAGGGCAAANVLYNFAADMGSVVKSSDPNHLLSLGTIGSGQCGAAGDDYQYVHSVSQIDVCEYHDYGQATVPMPGDQWNGLSRRLTQCAALGKPLFVGEMGIHIDEAGGSQATRAAYLDSKFRAQLGAGVDGIVLWNWNDAGTDPLTHYDIGPSDPAIGVVRGY